MLELDFIDISAKAKELGVSESVVRSRAMSGQLDAYVFLREMAEGSQEEFLPPWSFETFPNVRWRDLGTPFDPTETYEHGTRLFLTNKRRTIIPRPGYEVTGWVRLAQEFVATVFTRKDAISLEGWHVGIDDDDGHVVVTVRGRSEFRGPDDGYVMVCQSTGPDDVMFVAEHSKERESLALDARREKSLLRVIRALDVMARLPKRGAAAAIEAQIQALGFVGPNDETIRKILEEARGLHSEKPQ
ncbi:hypothetical protein JI752_018625 [Lysobacter sp. MMG2]|uniref:hypothetical protein n=1 Tax=Lysobacter sp. MMG2 TaxID=2801338 RepID=UPI001C20F8B8|nr:hypothetical protein [Lysobacter sp. MMG2]MBU8978167.1 hypothetical protein [Lysobacter sp. MMG2]